MSCLFVHVSVCHCDSYLMLLFEYNQHTCTWNLPSKVWHVIVSHTWILYHIYIGIIVKNRTRRMYKCGLKCSRVVCTYWWWYIKYITWSVHIYGCRLLTFTLSILYLFSTSLFSLSFSLFWLKSHAIICFWITFILRLKMTRFYIPKVVLEPFIYDKDRHKYR